MAAKEMIIVKGHCPECGAEKNAGILAEHEYKWTDEHDPIWGAIDYRILECRGCDTIYFQRAETFSEHINHLGECEVSSTYWPSPLKRPRPEWLSDLVFVDKNLHSILMEVYASLDNDLAVLAAIGMRTAFDCVTDFLGIDPGANFQKKLDALLNGGKVGATEIETLKVLTDAGSAAVHRGWRPKPKQLSTMMDVVENFCHKHLILTEQIGKLKPHIPERQKRRPAAKVAQGKPRTVANKKDKQKMPSKAQPAL